MKKSLKKNGFTLVEVIVVLVILAILSAIIVPSMVRWIDKSGEKSAVVEAHTCLVAMKTIAVERFTEGGQYTLAADKAATLQLAESPAGADILQATVDASGTVTKMVYKSADGIFVTYADGAFTTSRSAHSLGNTDDVQTVYNGFSQVAVGNGGMDSTAVISKENSKAKQVVDALMNAGLDLTTMGATTWKYMNANVNGGPYFYWTPVDIASKAVGDKVIVMRYNANRDRTDRPATYTVWEATVGLSNGLSNGKAYNILTGFGRILSSETKDPEKQTYELMISDYNKAVSGS